MNSTTYMSVLYVINQKIMESVHKRVNSIDFFYSKYCHSEQRQIFPFNINVIRVNLSISLLLFWFILSRESAKEKSN